MDPDWMQQRLVVHRHGHEIVVDHQGLAIDGRHIIRDGGLGPQDAVRPAANPRTSPAFQVLPGGSVVYRGRVVAELTPDVTVLGDRGPAWPSPDASAPAVEPEIAHAEMEMDL